MVMGTHLVAREVTLHKGTRRSREVTLHSKVTHLHLELTHLHLRRTLLHLGHTLMHLEQWEAAMGRRDSSPTSCKALLVLVVMAVMGTNPVATGTRRSRGTLGATLHNKGTLLSMGTPRSSMDTLHSSMDTPLPVTLAHLVTVVATEEAWAACSLEAQLLRLPPTEHTRFLMAATVEVGT
jgi:hypothetical protein